MSRGPTFLRASAAGLLALGSLATIATAGPLRITVSNPGPALGETPLIAVIREAVPPGGYVLSNAEDKQDNGRARVFVEGGRTVLAMVLTRLPAQGKLSLFVAPRDPSTDSRPGVELRAEGHELAVLTGGKLLTVHHADGGPKPFDYPLIGPTGTAVTRAYPMKEVAGEDHDHNHQRSMWFTHGNVNGVDFWASDPKNPPNPRFGSIRETSRQTHAGAAVGLIRTTDAWLGPDEKTVCEDERVMTAYDTTQARVFDVDVTVKATAGPVTFGDTKEGTFGLRVASSMDVTRKKGGKITNAEGLTDEAAWGKPSPWVDYTGPVEGKTLGIAVLNHPESLRYPTTWHVRTYGLFAANPFGWHDFGRSERGDYTIPAAGSARFRYRVILHEGDTASAHIAEAFRAYAEPPSVTVTTD